MRAAAALCLLLAAAGCEHHRDPQKQLVEENLLEASPRHIDNPSGAKLGSFAVYLGADVDSEVARPGAGFDVTHYFQVTAAPPAGAEVRVRLVGDGGEAAELALSPMMQAHPLSAWKPGQIIRDRQRVAIPASWRSPRARVEVSAGGEALGAAQVSIERGIYLVHRAAAPIAVDGRGADAAWKKAAWGPDFTVAKGGRQLPGSARARLLWDEQHLYALIEVVDDDVFSPYTKRDDTLWKADVVELFIDADRNRRGYVELQLNPRGAVFDSFFPVTRAQEHHFEWNSSMKTAVTVDGTADDQGDTDRGWVAEMAIPHGDVKGMAKDMKVEIPPRPGDRWRLNAVRVDKPKKGGLGASSWNPITIRDFHALGRMLTVRFAE